MNAFKISVVQFTPGLGTPTRNMDAIQTLLSGISTDLIILPELSTCGYSLISREEATAAAECQDGAGVLFFRQLAKKQRAMVIAGFAERNWDKVYNSALIASPDGQIKVYRKSHLFSREKECFDPGDTGFLVTEHPLKDCHIGVMICNDWRYPEAARTLALRGADVIACPCNLVSTAWQIGMPARALENKVYLAVANRCGKEVRELPAGGEQELSFTGTSAIYDFNGQSLAQAGAAESKVLTVQIDPLMTRDKSFNTFNDLFKDRRTDLYLR